MKENEFSWTFYVAAKRQQGNNVGPAKDVKEKQRKQLGNCCCLRFYLLKVNSHCRYAERENEKVQFPLTRKKLFVLSFRC